MVTLGPAISFPVEQGLDEGEREGPREVVRWMHASVGSQMRAVPLYLGRSRVTGDEQRGDRHRFAWRGDIEG
jgi:hypothetical protein